MSRLSNNEEDYGSNLKYCPECGAKLITFPIDISSPQGVGPTYAMGPGKGRFESCDIVCEKCGLVVDKTTRFEPP